MRHIVEPTQEEFDAWRDHPVSQFVAAAYEAKAEECRAQWARMFHAPLVAADLETKRQILNAQEDVFRAFAECTLDDCLAAIGAPATPSGTARSALARPKARSAIGPPRRINGVLNLGKIGEARLDLIPALDECNPGLRPTEYNVVVAPARASKTLGSGALHAPDEYIETAEMAMQVGRIVSMSPLAFNYDNAWPEGTKPTVGDIVWYARYAGALIECAFDGQMYRMVKDKDIAAIIDPPRADETAGAEG